MPLWISRYCRINIDQLFFIAATRIKTWPWAGRSIRSCMCPRPPGAWPGSSASSSTRASCTSWRRARSSRGPTRQLRKLLYAAKRTSLRRARSCQGPHQLANTLIYRLLGEAQERQGMGDVIVHRPWKKDKYRRKGKCRYCCLGTEFIQNLFNSL